ncbi:MAG: hypothetical protein GF410_13730, partial [Chitinivibrionales bacterium]|nr:hypothetical protein [Chitinivibrionales bacterium]
MKKTVTIAAAILAATIVAAVLYRSDFWRIDRCLDDGGKWNYELRRCEGCPNCSPEIDTSVAVAKSVPQPAVVIRKGACPFECCQYGAWVARSTIEVLAEPAGSVIDTLLPGDTVVTRTGEVYVTPSLFVLAREVDGANPGDTIHLLDYVGEGFFNAAHAGVDLGQVNLGFSPYGPDGERVHKSGELLTKMQSAWWVE